MGRSYANLAFSLRSVPIGNLILYRPIENGIEVARVVSGYRNRTPFQDGINDNESGWISMSIWTTVKSCRTVLGCGWRTSAAVPEYWLKPRHSGAIIFTAFGYHQNTVVHIPWQIKASHKAGVISPSGIAHRRCCPCRRCPCQDVLLAPIESVIPLPHQLKALSKAVSSDRIRYLLADEVGLGQRQLRRV